MFRLLIYVLLTIFFVACGNSNDLSNKNLDTNSIKVKDLLIDNTINAKNNTINKNITLFEGYLNKEYSYDLKSEAHLSGENFYIYSDNLPEGLELNEKTGVISGTPVKKGNFKFEIAIKSEENGEPLVIRPVNISIGDSILFYKDVRSFIDLSKSVHSNTIDNNQLIDLSSSPAKDFFKFYNQGISSVRVCQQGYLKLDGNDCSYSSDFNNNNIIAPFADPELVQGTDSKIYYQIRGLQPRRMLIVQFKNMHRTTDTKASQNFEVIIYESSNRISFLYGLSYSFSDNTQKHLGTNAVIGLYSPNKQYIVSPEDANTDPKPIIFDGTVITFKAPDLNTTQYTKKLDGNLVTDFIDISRYLEESQDCSSDSQCRISNKCINNTKCAANILTVPLLYDNAKKVDLPFNFNFYGNSYNDIKVHENGYLFFDSENYNYYSQKPTKNTAMPVNQMGLNYVIAGLFSNIELKSVGGGNILYNVIGESPNRKAIFLYDKVKVIDPANKETSHICTFEIKLHETSNIIEFIYGTNNNSSFCNGLASSVGLKKDDTDYISIVANNPVIKQGKSIIFVPNDNLANSYTWVGIGNQFRNSNATNGVNGKFEKVPSQWYLIDDQPATEFVNYDKTVVPDHWLNTDGYSIDGFQDDNYLILSTQSLGLTFDVYGNPRSLFYLQSNGGVTFESGVIDYTEPSSLGYSGSPLIGLFPYWNDLDPTEGEIRGVVYTGGSEAILVFEWNQVPARSYGIIRNSKYTFQIQIYEKGQIYMCYKEMINGNRNTSYLSGVRKNHTDYKENLYSLQDLATTSNCVAYTPVYKYPPNHIVATRSTTSSKDGGEENVALGFSYNFMGTMFNHITIGSNGIARFENAPANDLKGHNEKLSSINAYDNSLALFWDNLNPRDNPDPASGIFYTTTGTAPNRQFILSYNAVPHGRVNGNSRISTQLVIKEDSPNILYCYGDLSGAYHTGDSATIGVRKTKTNYTQLSYNNGILNSNECYEWSPPSPGYVEARNIFDKETNADFIDIPIEHSGFGEGEYLEDLYGSKPYTIYDLNSQNYNFSFKGRVYDQLFVDAKGAVSFGNNDDAAIVTAPMWGNIFYQSDIAKKLIPSLQTPYEDIKNNFMWIANAGDNSLSKINTFDGTVSGPYSVGGSPSRTSVGFDGSVWVGNRSTHNVTKLDKDGNEICTVNLVSGCAPRAVALDKDENAWIGCGAWKYDTPDGWVYKIRDNHNETGNRCEILDLRAPNDNSDPSIPENRAFKAHNRFGHYGFAVDKHGILWSSPGTHNNTHNYFLRIDTNKHPSDPGFYKRFRGYSNNSHKVGDTWESREGVDGGNDGTPFKFYGIAIDLNGDLWLGNWGHTNKNRAITKAHYDETNNKLIFEIFPSYQNKDVSNARGVAVDKDGFLYVAYSGTNNVGKFDSQGNAVALFYLDTNTGNPDGNNTCDQPTGIGVDGDGDVWANCLGTSNSEELDANNGHELKSLPTGQSPYCYSDNTGFNLRNIVTDGKPEKYYAGITNYVAYPNEANCEYRSRKLVVEWRDVRLYTDTNYGYTEASFEMIFNNGYRYDCDDVSTVKSIHPVKIEFVYGAMQGNKYSQKTGGQSMITLKSLYSDYNHVFGDQDAGTVNTGSKLIITSEK